VILDTNALSAVADEQRGIALVLAGAQQLALPAVVIGEYRFGIAQSRHRAHYRRWLDAFIDDCTVLEIGEPTAHHYAAIGMELKAGGTPIPTNDLWIAALCRQHGLPLLSRDRHFDAVAGLQRVQW
jgi:predicted nucleic acid-binding protein